MLIHMFQKKSDFRWLFPPGREDGKHGVRLGREFLEQRNQRPVFYIRLHQKAGKKAHPQTSQQALTNGQAAISCEIAINRHLFLTQLPDSGPIMMGKRQAIMLDKISRAIYLRGIRKISG